MILTEKQENIVNILLTKEMNPKDYLKMLINFTETFGQIGLDKEGITKIDIYDKLNMYEIGYDEVLNLIETNDINNFEIETNKEVKKEVLDSDFDFDFER